MSHQIGAATSDEHAPPLSKDLDAVQVRYTWKFGDGGRDPSLAPQEAAEAPPEETELERLQAQVKHFTAALEDIVTLALSSADYKERAIMMHRRAVAALTGPRPRTREGDK